jgi:hypothetical protein
MISSAVLVGSITVVIASLNAARNIHIAILINRIAVRTVILDVGINTRTSDCR